MERVFQEGGQSGIGMEGATETVGEQARPSVAKAMGGRRLRYIGGNNRDGCVTLGGVGVFEVGYFGVVVEFGEKLKCLPSPFFH